MSNKAPLDYQLNTSFGTRKFTLSKLLIDPILVFSLLTILIFGLFVLFSASGQTVVMVMKQSIYVAIGLFLMFFISRLDQSVYKSFFMHLFWFGLILLVWVLLFPAEGYKTDRWIDLGFISFQPSEVIRLLLPLAAASYLTRNQKRNTIKDWVVVLVAILSSSFLIFKQPDLGTALIVLASGCIPVFLAGFPLLILIILIMVVIISSPFLWASLTPYMQQRVITLFNPESDLLGAGWNISQSKTAIGSGGFWGKGYLNGTQSQLDFIPESHSDFIFSVIGEEFGFLGIFLLLMLYGIILYRVFKIALNSSTEFSRLAATSIGFIFLIYIWINVSMTVGTLPVVGVPLPLISQGGTSILIHLVAFGFVLSMKRRQTW
ncbi:MAG: rod shape-determining protein RodA [SAR86 cluster bacterium]|jgi:rod shape determining protein RodA|nr:rod shape-determining protein RodA [SAR86 cluster bacterium]|tara:strand:+ start:1911 stop:3038 length:1128 start_codon:yes stop_codon:yes gene_type:complete